MNIAHPRWRVAPIDWQRPLARARGALGPLWRALIGAEAPPPFADEPAIDFEDQLAGLCAATVGFTTDPLQHVTLTTTVAGPIPPAHHIVVLRVAQELLRTAVAQGMDMHLIGRIDVRVEAGRNGTVLAVTDDGWGQKRRRLEAPRLLAERAGGRFSLEVSWANTVTRLWLPLH